MSRLYRNIIQASLEALDRIFSQQEQADKVVARTLKKDKRWGARDRRFIAETIYDIVRWYRYLYEHIGRTPESTQDWWQIFAVYWTILKGETLPDWEEWQELDLTTFKHKSTILKQHRAIQVAIPDWLDQLGEQELGEHWETIISNMNKQADVILRVNTLKTNRELVLKKLQTQNIEGEKVDLYPDAIRLKKRRNLQANPYYQKGWFEIQDLASQQIAAFIDPQPNMQLIDACAGAGGKSLHLAAKMNNKGKIWAADIYPQKLKELQKRAKRAGIQIIQSQIVNSKSGIQTITIPRGEQIDCILLDVPCSGLGVLRRNPDTKWKLQKKHLEQLQATQAQLLEAYAKLCHKGTVLVYATCSILPSENQNQIQRFLETKLGKKFDCVDQKSLYPHQDGTDGFYMAKLVCEN
ncbi:MAG: RsmB/NOP family class I SAM-dependent RNA methyltransferase [Saprospiraceae bacterium]|nr:RsmB/NOP family class I SAM-dependent RNA methyltransferase [Saprospiraceae bacterium]